VKYRVEATYTGFSSLRAIGEKKILHEADELVGSLAINPSKKGEVLSAPLERYRKASFWRNKYRLIYEVLEEKKLVYVHWAGKRMPGNPNDVYEAAKIILRPFLPTKIRDLHET